MAWSAPMTVTAGSALTSAIFNREVRDNLNAQAVAKGTTASSYFATYSANLIVERFAATQTVLTSETSTSLNWTDLTTVGPTLTCTTGTKALVLFNARQSNATTNAFVACSVAVTGTTSIPAHVNWAWSSDGKVTVSQSERNFGMHLFDTLNAGSNTFTMQYLVASGTGTWLDRELVVLPL